MKTMKTFIHISDLHIAEMKRPGIEGKNERTDGRCGTASAVGK